MSAASTPAALAVAAALFAAAEPTHADIYGYNNGATDRMWGVHFMPDFDQVRSDFPIAGLDGLPGDGTMYCLPTCAANMAAYLTWRGIGPWPASMNWTSNAPAVYNTATAHIAQIGAWMSTSATEGTGYPGSYNGALELFGGIPYDVGYFKVNGSGNWAWSPMLYDLTNYGLSGGIVDFVFGRYDWHWDGGVVAEARTGGHCLTLTRGTITPGGNEIQFRNSSTGAPDNSWTQSAFATSTRGAVDVLVNRMGTDVWMTNLVPADGHTSQDESVALIDSALVIWPTWLLIDPPPSGGQLVIETNPIDFNPATDLVPVQRPNVPSIPGEPIDFAIRPDRQVIASLFRLSPTVSVLEATPTQHSLVTMRVTFDRAVGVVYNRFMELCVLTPTHVIMYSTDAGQISELGRIALPAGAEPVAIEYHDVADEVWVLDASAHRIHRFDHRLAAPRRPLELTPLVNGDPLVPASDATVSMSIGRRHGEVWIANDRSGKIARYTPTLDAGVYAPTQILSGPSLIPTDVQLDGRGRLLVASDGGLFEYADTNGDGIVEPVPAIYSGPRPHRKFEVTTSRSNALFPEAELPGWRDVLIPGEFDEGSVADCPGDFDGSGATTSADFFAFLAAFFEGRFSADVNRDGLVNSADFFDYLTAFFSRC